MVRAQIKVVTGDTSFVPNGLEPVSVPPGSTVRVPLNAELDKALRDGALGVSVEADGPITASLLTSLEKDRVLTVPDDDVTAEAATLLPVVTGPDARKNPVSARLLLSADAAGSAVVTTYDASGTQLSRRTVASQQGHTVALDLPRGTAFVHVEPRRTPVRGAVLVSGDGLGATVHPADRAADAGPGPADLAGPELTVGGSVVAAVARVDVLGVDAEQLRDLLDDARSAPSPPGRRASRSGARSAAGTAPAGSAWCRWPRTSDASGTVSPAQSSGSCGVSSTAYSTSPSRSCQRVSMSRTVSRTSSSKRSPRVGSSGRPGSDGVMAGPRMPRPRRSRVRRRPAGATEVTRRA